MPFTYPSPAVITTVSLFVNPRNCPKNPYITIRLNTHTRACILYTHTHTHKIAKVMTTICNMEYCNSDYNERLFYDKPIKWAINIMISFTTFKTCIYEHAVGRQRHQ